KKAPILPSKRPVAPRRSILTIVEPKTPQAPTIIKPAPERDKKAGPSQFPEEKSDKPQRFFRMNKESLDQMVEEEAKKKKIGSPRNEDIRPEDVRFADYRKKEMVFLP